MARILGSKQRRCKRGLVEAMYAIKLQADTDQLWRSLFSRPSMTLSPAFLACHCCTNIQGLSVTLPCLELITHPNPDTHQECIRYLAVELMCSYDPNSDAWSVSLAIPRNMMKTSPEPCLIVWITYLLMLLVWICQRYFDLWRQSQLTNRAFLVVPRKKL